MMFPSIHRLPCFQLCRYYVLSTQPTYQPTHVLLQTKCVLYYNPTSSQGKSQITLLTLSLALGRVAAFATSRLLEVVGLGATAAAQRVRLIATLSKG